MKDVTDENGSNRTFPFAQKEGKLPLHALDTISKSNLSLYVQLAFMPQQYEIGVIVPRQVSEVHQWTFFHANSF